MLLEYVSATKGHFQMVRECVCVCVCEWSGSGNEKTISYNRIALTGRLRASAADDGSFAHSYEYPIPPVSGIQTLERSSSFTRDCNRSR